MAGGLSIKLRAKRYPPTSRFVPPSRCVQVGYAPTRSELTFYLPRRHLDAIFRHARAYPRIEVGGYLFGQPYVDEREAIVVVRGLYPIVSTDANSVHFRFRVEDNARADQCLEASYPDSEIVGWFHTHPGHGVFMSSVDVSTHTTYFSPSHRVAMVVDPVNRTFGAFAHRKGVVYCLPSIMVADDEADAPPVVVAIPRTVGTKRGNPAGARTPARPQEPRIIAPDQSTAAVPDHQARTHAGTGPRANVAATGKPGPRAASGPIGRHALGAMWAGMLLLAVLMTYCVWLVLAVARDVRGLERIYMSRYDITRAAPLHPDVAKAGMKQKGSTTPGPNDR